MISKDGFREQRDPNWKERWSFPRRDIYLSLGRSMGYGFVRL